MFKHSNRENMNLSASLQHAAFQKLKGTVLILYLYTQGHKKINFSHSWNSPIKITHVALVLQLVVRR